MENSFSKKERLKENLKTNGLAIAFVSPYVITFIAFFVVPLVMGVFLSFFKYDPYDSSIFSFVGFDNYLKLFQDNILSRTFWESLKTTLLFDAICVPLLIIIPLLLAYLINLKPYFANFFRALIYLPSVVSITIVGIVFGAIFSGQSQGLFNSFFNTSYNFLGDEFLRWVVILIVSIWWGSGSNFIILAAALKNVPKSLYEACECDGGGRFSKFFNVTLPYIKGTINIALFTTLVSYLNLYGQPKVLNTSINQNDIVSPMMLIQMWLNDVGKSSLTGMVIATAVVFGVIIIIISSLEKALFKERKGGNKYVSKYKEYISK